MESFDPIHLQSTHTHPTSQFLLFFSSFHMLFAIRQLDDSFWTLSRRRRRRFRFFLLLFFATFFLFILFLWLLRFYFHLPFFLSFIYIYCICCAISFRVYNNFYSLLCDEKVTRANFHKQRLFWPMYVSAPFTPPLTFWHKIVWHPFQRTSST